MNHQLLSINHSRSIPTIRPWHAFTLIELLAAMGVAVLLAVVVFAIYAGVLRTLDSQGRWRARAYPLSAALDALSLDLANAAIPWGITNAPFVLAPSVDGADGFDLHFFSAVPVNAAPRNAAQALNVRGYALREISYTLPASNAAGTNGAPCAARGLSRAWAAFRTCNPSVVVSNRDVFGGIGAVRLEVFDGKNWTNTWGGGTNAALPQAARVLLAVEDGARVVSAEVMIPAGHRIAAPKSRK
jgi:hypothetical protein